MEEFKVNWSHEAKDDLRRIVKYINEAAFSSVAGANLEAKIIAAADKLSYSPYRVFYDRRRGIRKCLVDSYLILFKIDENTTPKSVVIRQIIHGKRNLRKWVR